MIAAEIAEGGEMSGLSNYLQLDYRGLTLVQLEKKWKKLAPINRSAIFLQTGAGLLLSDVRLNEACHSRFYDLWSMMTPDEIQSVIDEMVRV
jgi:hypothetical protein